MFVPLAPKRFSKYQGFYIVTVEPCDAFTKSPRTRGSPKATHTTKAESLDFEVP